MSLGVRFMGLHPMLVYIAPLALEMRLHSPAGSEGPRSIRRKQRLFEPRSLCAPCDKRRRLFAAALRSGDDFEGAHHVVGFVFEDVAVVEVFARVAFEADDNAGDHSGGTLNDIFPAEFV